MPVFMKFDGVEGRVSANSGGAIVVMSDGSVRFLRDSINTSFRGGGPRVVVFDGVTNSRAPVNTIEVSKIYFPNSSSGGELNTINSLDANATAKARTFFYDARGFGQTSGIIVSLSKTALSKAAAKMTRTHNIKQLSLGAHTPIPALDFLIFDGGNSKEVRIEMRNVLVSSYQISGSDGGGIPIENYILKFAQIKFVSGHKFSLTRHYA